MDERIDGLALAIEEWDDYVISTLEENSLIKQLDAMRQDRNMWMQLANQYFDWWMKLAFTECDEPIPF